MGRFEKIVVLTVLFLVAVILGVALNPSAESNANGGPLGKRNSETASGSTQDKSSGSATRGDLELRYANGKSERNQPSIASARLSSGSEAMAQGDAPSPRAPGGLLSANVNRGATQTPSTPRDPAATGQATPALSELVPTGPTSQVAGQTGGQISGGVGNESLIGRALNAGTNGTAGNAAPPASNPAPRPSAVVPSQVPAQPLIPGTILVSSAGLEPSLIPEAMLYSWQAGDTFAALAARFYGRSDMVSQITAANEGRSDRNLRPGEKLFVPVQASASEDRLVRRTTTQAPSAWTGGSFYTVQKGDVLGSIAQKVYGSSKHWNKIFEANSDLLGDPNSLKVGQRLRIPE